MAYLTEKEIRARAGQILQRVQKTAGQVLAEAAASNDQKFDIFLSHSSGETQEVLLGVKALLEDNGFSVYIDKYSDPQLSPENATQKTATILRDRMRNSNSLLYLYSQHSKRSRWMPWELGFFDGLKGAVGVLPVTQNQEETFKGEEYLNLYPYVDVATAANSSDRRLWINAAADTYALLDRWVAGTEKIRKRTP